MDIARSIEQFIIEELMVGDEDMSLRPDESLLENGIVDSLGILQIVAFIEEQFSIVVEDAEVVLDNFETVDAIKALVERKQSEG